jgi:hypothetical protein
MINGRFSVVSGIFSYKLLFLADADKITLWAFCALCELCEESFLARFVSRKRRRVPQIKIRNSIGEKN